jgi:large subunit ribosomal protein L13
VDSLLQYTINPFIFFNFPILQENKENIVNTISNKTYNANSATVDKKWVIIDAEDQPLGRLSSKVATLLRGKHKPEFTPHADTGDNVIVINAEKVQLTGKKLTNKKYFRHTGFIGSETYTSALDMQKKDPTALITIAVKGMLPKNKLSRQVLKNLRVYAGSVHPHTAQQPEILEI